MMRLRSHPALRRARAAFSITELLISSSLLGVLLSSLGVLSLKSGQASKQAQVELNLSSKVHRLCTRLAHELESAGEATLNPDPGLLGASSFQFQSVSAVAGATVNWTSETGLAWLLDPAEADNGEDDDGDGLIDEGDVVLTRQALSAQPTSIVLCRNVSEYMAGETPNGADDNGNGLIDERGFCVRKNGKLLSLFLSVEDAREDDVPLVTTLTTTLRLRN